MRAYIGCYSAITSKTHNQKSSWLVQILESLKGCLWILFINPCHAEWFKMPRTLLISTNHITWSRLLIKIHTLNEKQYKSRSVGFFRVYPGLARLGLMIIVIWASPSKNVSSSMRKMHRFRFILRMRKVSSGHLFSIDTFYSVQWVC